MNKVIFMGNLTRDPEIRYAQGSDTAVARFGLAVNRRYKREGEPDTDFFNCTAFGKQAEFVEKYFKQGTRALVVGRVQNDNYTNKNGEKVYSVQILVEEIEFGEKKGSQTQGTPNPQNAQAPDDDGFMNVPEGIEDGLPFN